MNSVVSVCTVQQVNLSASAPVRCPAGTYPIHILLFQQHIKIIRPSKNDSEHPSFETVMHGHHQRLIEKVRSATQPTLSIHPAFPDNYLLSHTIGYSLVKSKDFLSCE